jgi:hypothetical protein
LHLRIPAWCKKAVIKVNGETWAEPDGNQIVNVNRKWKDKDIVELILPMEVFTSRWFNNSIAVERGPLVYALKVNEEWNSVKGTDKYGDYREVRPRTPWNYGILEEMLKAPRTSFKVNIKSKSLGYPWNVINAPIELKARQSESPNGRFIMKLRGRCHTVQSSI